MRFKSPTEEPIHIALTSGHTCVIGPDFIEVAPMFRRDAVARGAEPEGVGAAPPKAPGDPTKADLIYAALKVMVEADQAEEFAADGSPKATALSARCGFTVLREERDAAWNRMQAEL